MQTKLKELRFIEVVKMYDRNFLESPYFPQSVIILEKSSLYLSKCKKRNVPKNDSRFMEIVLSSRLGRDLIGIKRRFEGGMKSISI